MKFNKTDLAHSRNMLKVLGKGEWKLEGMEILAFAEMMKWFANLQRTVEYELAQDEANEKARAAEQEKLKAGNIIPKPVENPIKQMDPASSAPANKKPSKKSENK